MNDVNNGSLVGIITNCPIVSLDLTDLHEAVPPFWHRLYTRSVQAIILVSSVERVNAAWKNWIQWEKENERESKEFPVA